MGNPAEQVPELRFLRAREKEEEEQAAKMQAVAANNMEAYRRLLHIDITSILSEVCFPVCFCFPLAGTFLFLRAREKEEEEQAAKMMQALAANDREAYTEAAA